MTIKDCPVCGGTHYGSYRCPYIKAPCVVCGDETILACSDCAVNSGGKISVHVCNKKECRLEHDKQHPPKAAMTDQPERPKCELCGEPMPPGEEMFKYHGHSGPCPRSPGAVELMNPIEGPSEAMPPIFSRGRLVEMWKEHGGAVDKKGRAWIELDLLVPLLHSIIERAAPHIVKERSKHS